MNQVAFIFPGQGAQYVGMGKDFYENRTESRAIYECASDMVGFDVGKLCFEDEQIHKTEYTQIAMVATELAILRALEKEGVRPHVYGGLSLGEYTAITGSGALKEEDAFSLIRKRGIYMQEAYPDGGAMAAILGMDGEMIEKICKEIDGIVEIANYNCPGQIVITGEKKSVEKACIALKEAGARRTMLLNVSGPFHSPLMKRAGEQLEEALQDVSIIDPHTPYITNVTAEYIKNKEEIKSLLVRQVSSSVRWHQSMENMISKGVDTFIEIGPGKTLSGFTKKINKDLTMMQVEKIEDLDGVIQYLLK